MEEMTSQSWKRKGSSLVWSRELLTPIILNTEPTSLHTVLKWLRDGFPASPPRDDKTVLIGGMQTVLETMSNNAAAYDWLRHNILPLFRQAGHHWSSVSLVFAMDGPSRLFTHNEADDLVYYGRGTDRSKQLPISRAIWNGAATGRGAYKLIAEETREVGGYHVQHVS